MQESKQEVMKVISLVNIGRKLTNCIQSPLHTKYLLVYVTSIALDNSGYQLNIFLISQKKKHVVGSH